MSQPGRGGRADRKSWRLRLEAVSKGIRKERLRETATRKGAHPPQVSQVKIPMPTLEERDALAQKQLRVLDTREENAWARSPMKRLDGRVELLCKQHGTGHPHRELTELYGRTWEDWMGVHGCCGCCAPPELGAPGDVEEAAGWEA